jgi:hypothetical protein
MFPLRKILGTSVFVWMLLLCSQGTHAQVSTLPFQQFMGTYTPLGTNGTPLPTLSSYDDRNWAFTLPFPFPFNGVMHNTVYVGTNGYLTFGYSTSTLGGIISYSPNFGVGGGAIAAYSRDQHGRKPVSYAVTGSAPNRVLIFEFDDWTRFSATGTGVNDHYNFQFKLSETSGMIEIVYGTWTVVYGNLTGQVGVRGSTNADYNNRSISNGVNTWLTSAPGTSSSNTCAMTTAGLVPPSGLTYRWGCYVPDGIVNLSVSDASGNPQAFFYTPGSLTVNYTVSYPLDEAYDVPITLNFYKVGDVSGVPAYTESFVAQKPIGVLNGSYTMNNLNLAVGYYNIEAVFSVYNNCLSYEDVMAMTSTLFILQGTQLCEVWPGDANTDGVVTYADRAALNRYILNANLSPLWLQGPARYLLAAEINPLAYLEWTPQASIPWNTPDGCFKDTDGNGVINNFDYIAIKMNWLRTNATIPSKDRTQFSTVSFDMDQNFPNPFNPTTSIRYAAPERSMVRLVVNDMFGREVAILANEIVDAGVHTVQFDAGQLSSGTYIATIRMAGTESGLTFSKTIRMALNK